MSMPIVATAVPNTPVEMEFWHDRPFRLHDYIEVLENGEKPGLKGRVIDVNLIYTTLQETGDGHEGTVLQLPNNLFFQRTVRRWRDPAQAPGGIQGDG